jgi:hypothetical protein
VRVDGKPFARDLASLAAGATLNPPTINENGATIGSATAQITLTGTLGDGTLASTSGIANTCTDWTYAGASSPPSLRAGLVALTLDAWTATGVFSCNSTGRLLCFESGAAVVSKLPSFEQEGALAFATATTDGGNLGAWPQAAGATGLAAGDAICRNSAIAAAHPHAAGYVAWLSDLGVAHAIDRLVYDGSWKRLDGVEIATSKADLLAADSFVYALQSPLNVTEWGVYQDHQAITGTNTQGLATGTDCMGWTDGTNLQSADYGFPFDSRGSWTKQSSITVLCNAFYRLYCFGSVPILFWDSFEPGTASRWWAKYP